jgi:hypothetical protein
MEEQVTIKPDNLICGALGNAPIQKSLSGTNVTSILATVPAQGALPKHQ